MHGTVNVKISRCARLHALEIGNIDAESGRNFSTTDLISKY